MRQQMQNKCRYLFMLAFALFLSVSVRAQKSLMPDRPSKSPDYFCTWSVQGYVVNFSGAENTRAAMNEQNIWGKNKYQGWIHFFPKIRRDLYFLMDDSWDIPKNENRGDNRYLGLAELDSTRFPSFRGSPGQRLKKFTDKIKSFGWKGVGGWVCAQESPVDSNCIHPRNYWANKLKSADSADFRYWKVDWGRHDHDVAWRKMLTELGHKYAPNLFIEHVMDPKCIDFCDVYRTYDVENIISVPVTITRIIKLLQFHAAINGYKGLINCEDEPYIAAGLGCSIGVMRYPFVGALPDGTQDAVFPPIGRNLKKRLDEVTRAVRWHRIAEPFGGNVPFSVDSVSLTDDWLLHNRETWRNRPEGKSVFASAPARVSRNMPLPLVSNLHSKWQPFILASKYPNGAVAVASIGRSHGRIYQQNKEKVCINVSDQFAPIGIFGDYKELIINYPQKIEKQKIYIMGQDLAGDHAIDITKSVKIKTHKLILSGNLIRKIGLMDASKNDISSPGMVLQLFLK